MRYYDIGVFDSTGALGQVAKKHWSSFVNNRNVPGALNVEFDFPIYNYAAPLGACFLRVWGIPLSDIAQASDLNGLTIQVRAGMQKGLPLANPKQAGLVLTGEIQQCYGNWQGNEQNLNMMVTFGGNLGSPDGPANIAFEWLSGFPMDTAISSVLRVAFPTLAVTVNISDKLVRSDLQVGIYASLAEFSEYVLQISKATVGGDYGGVRIALRNGGIVVYDEFATLDGISATNPKQIEFVDLIGQPTWFGFGQINLKTVMRSDLQVGDFVKMPPGPVTILPQSFSQYRDKSVFQGVFLINQLRHLGNFRQPDANSWCTVVDAVII